MCISRPINPHSIDYIIPKLCRIYTLEAVDLGAASVEVLAVSVSFISNTGKLAVAGTLGCVGNALSLLAVLDD